MKRITLILLVLCMAIVLLAMVSCGDNSAETTLGGEATLTPDSTHVTEPPFVDDTSQDNEEDIYISVLPSDSDEKWGELNRAEN